MKLKLFLYAFFIIILSSITLANLQATGESWNTPFTVSSFEIVDRPYLNETNGYVFYRTDTHRAGIFYTNNIITSPTSYSGAFDNYPFTYQTIGDDIILVSSTYSSNSIINFADVLTSASGTKTVTRVSNALDVSQVYGTNGILNINETHYKGSDFTIHELPITVTNPLLIDSLDENSVIVYTNDSEVFEILNGGDVINSGTVSLTDVKDLFTYDDKIYLVTENNFYEYVLTPYYFIEEINYSDTLCVDETHLCNNTQFTLEDGITNFWCDLDDYFRCDGLCSNVENTDSENITYIKGECVYTGCLNECVINGITECYDSQHQITCGQYDSDVCLEYSPITECLNDQICGSNNKCEDINYSSYGSTIEYPSFIVSPVLVNDWKNLDYSIDGNKISVDSSYLVHNQEFKVNPLLVGTDLYGTVNCDYKQDDLYSKNTVFQIENSSTYETPTTTNNVITELNFNFDNISNNDSVSFTLGNNANEYTKIIVYNDVSSGKIRVYYNDFSNLIISSDSYTGDSLKNIFLRILINADSNLVDVYTEYSFDDGTTTYVQEVQSTPILFNSLASYMDKLDISLSNSSLTISDLNIYSPNELLNINSESFDNNLFTCSYYETGCYDVRFYITGNDVPVYNNYVDKLVCINSLGSKTSTVTDETEDKTLDDTINDFQNISLIGKLLLMFLIIGGTALLFFSDIEENPFKKYVGIGLITLEVIIFIFIGLIPFWILFIVFIIIALITTKLLRNIFFSGG